jgi:thioesterase domain-containing protein
MGGTIAYEMAHQLQLMGEEIFGVILLDTYAPAGNGALTKTGRASLLRRFARDLGLSLDGYSQQWEELRKLDLDSQLEIILKEATEAKLVVPHIGLSRISQLFKVFESNVRAVQGYKPGAFPIKVTLFRAREETGGGVADPTLGWATLATGGVDAHTVPGSHYTMVQEPNIRTLAESLKACINGAEGSDK